MPRTNKPTTNPARKSEPSNSALGLEGRKAPAFELPDLTGAKVALKDLIGRQNLVLYFYPKDMTPGCTAEACSFRDNLATIKKLGANLVGISADPPASHQKFASKNSLDFPLLSDADNRVGRLYRVYKKKSLYGREFMGIERTTFLIDRGGTIRKVFPKVKVSGHSDEVITALKEIG
jgi:thioredoxin-dependent peroxiredoxin